MEHSSSPHRERAHSRQFRCDYCTKTYSKLEHLTTHGINHFAAHNVVNALGDKMFLVGI
ncbi:hypothetical protein AFLA70_484g000690 [Aspergillus flavus AF70]|nr:hypothetical protein AFLA70_484g000690 [Aspergillus flavus AF70]